MCGGQYLAGDALIVATLLPLAAGAFAMRSWALPGWRGAQARLAEVVAAVAALVVAAELLGAVGAFRRGILAATHCFPVPMLRTTTR